MTLIWVVCDKNPLREPRVRKSLEACLAAEYKVMLWPLHPLNRAEKRVEKISRTAREFRDKKLKIRSIYLGNWFRAAVSKISFRSLVVFLVLTTLLGILPLFHTAVGPVTGRDMALDVYVIAGILLLCGLAVATVARFRRQISAFLPTVGGKLESLQFRFRRRQARPDLLYFHDLTVLEEFSTEKEKGWPKIFWDAHEFFPELFEDDSNPSKMAQGIESVFASIDGFVTVNELIADLYQQHGPGLPPATIVQNAADWLGIVENDGRLHRAAGIGSEQRVLLYHGYLHKNRGIHYLLEMAYHLPENWTVVFMGEGELEDDIVRGVESANLKGNSQPSVALLPMVPPDELVFWTAGATLGAIFYEPRTANQQLASPNKLWEYARAGVPTVSYAGEFLSRVITENEIGWVVDYSFSAIETAEFIASRDEQELLSTRKKSLRFAEENNSLTEIAKLKRAIQGAISGEIIRDG